MKCILQPSQIEEAGVGVFTLADIKKGERLLLESPYSKVILRDLSQIPDEFLKYCPLLPSGKFMCPEFFHHMNIFWYLNHSNTPNIDWRKDGLFAKKDIQCGTELTVYYPDLETHPKNKLWNKKYLF